METGQLIPNIENEYKIIGQPIKYRLLLSYKVINKYKITIV